MSSVTNYTGAISEGFREGHNKVLYKLTLFTLILIKLKHCT